MENIHHVYGQNKVALTICLAVQVLLHSTMKQEIILEIKKGHFTIKGLYHSLKSVSNQHGFKYIKQLTELERKETSTVIELETFLEICNLPTTMQKKKIIPTRSYA